MQNFTWPTILQVIEGISLVLLVLLAISDWTKQINLWAHHTASHFLETLRTLCSVILIVTVRGRHCKHALRQLAWLSNSITCRDLRYFILGYLIRLDQR